MHGCEIFFRTPFISYGTTPLSVLRLFQLLGEIGTARLDHSDWAPTELVANPLEGNLDSQLGAMAEIRVKVCILLSV